MYLYFFLVRLAALLGNKKARLLIQGQKDCLAELQQANDKGLIAHSEKEQLIWFHAASVGEFEQTRPIIERLRSEHKPCKILLTFFSPSGYEMRKNYDKVNRVLYLPFATRRNAKLFLDAVRPDMAIFSKYEFWPAYLKELKRRSIPTYSICAIFRKSQLFFMPWGRPYLNLLKCFTHIFVQDRDSLNLLQRHGITECSVAGDTRFDRVHAIKEQGKNIPLLKEFCGAGPVIVAGSSWPADEVLLARYIEEHEEVRLVLVPHEINEEHLHTIFQTFLGRYVRYTEATKESITQCRILVLDTMGMLSSLYRYATVAYIGGGFGVGIHNTLEAAVYGIPVLFGPNYKKFREAKGLIAVGASTSVKNYRQLAAALDEALMLHKEKGEMATQYVESELGATERIYQALGLEK